MKNSKEVSRIPTISTTPSTENKTRKRTMSWTTKKLDYKIPRGFR